MLIEDATRGELEAALYFINEYWDNNIIFDQYMNPNPDDPKLWRVTLKVQNVNGPGHSITRPEAWAPRIVTACWHVYMTFYQELPDTAKVRRGPTWLDRSSDPWNVWEKAGLPITEFCECDQTYKKAYAPQRQPTHRSHHRT
jgi:hypothetical protein